MLIRIDEAIARAKAQGNKVMKKELAARLWPNSTESAQMVNMTHLCTGRTVAIKPEWQNIICDVTGCTADFLIGRTND